MLAVTKTAPDRVDIQLTGQLDSETMERGLTELLSASEGVEHGRMLYTITSFAMPTFGALGVEMRFLPKLFGLLGKFDRCAVVSDADWLRTAAEIEGVLIPGLQIKAFMPSEHDDAEAWLNE